MKRQRLNLFKEITGQKASKNGAPKEIKLGFRGYVCIASFILFCAIAIPSFIRYQTDKRDLEERILKAEQDLNSLIQRSAEMATQMQTERRIAKTEEKKTDQPKADIVPIDGTWVSLLWKLATFTTEQVVLHKLDFQMGGGTSTVGAGARKIVIDGQAKSQAALTEWLEGLSATLPSADFSLEKQGLNNVGAFKLEFKVTAIVL